jgi:hypothetical protein
MSEMHDMVAAIEKTFSILLVLYYVQGVPNGWDIDFKEKKEKKYLAPNYEDIVLTL